MLLGTALIVLPLFSIGFDASKLVQSLIVEFPNNGRVIVQAREEVGKNPRMLFIRQATAKVLLDYVYDEMDDSLKPRADSLGTEPFLRFRVIRSKGFPSPLILAVAVSPGGSDDGLCGAVIGEVNGKLKALTPRRLYVSVQGGYYLGFLNNKLGYGLASWSFIWGNEVHYDYHHYKIEIYTLQKERFIRRQTIVSKRRYDGNGVKALGELGISAKDQRAGIPKVRERLE